MDNPAARSLLDTIRQINEMAERARSGQPGVEEYLRAVAADPTTAWFTELLHEKTAEVEAERNRADEMARALQVWYQTRHEASELSTSEGDEKLIEVLRSTKIVDG